MPDALDGDFSRSRAVLIGTWDYRYLRPVPAAKNSLNRMRALLTSPLCGSWPQGRISVVRNRKTLGELPHELVTWFGAATDVALFYYVGHGQYDNDDRLCLALRDSSDDAVLRTTTSLSFDAVRHAFRVSKATTKVAILDCCFAGLAGRDDALAGSQTRDLPRSPGFYLMMSSGEFSTAWCEIDENTNPQTYFTKYLADVIENGVPGQPDQLALGVIFEAVADALVRDHKPEPSNRASGRAAYHILARNAALVGAHDNDLSTNQAATVAVPDAAESERSAELMDAEPRLDEADGANKSGWQALRGRRKWIAGAAAMAVVTVAVLIAVFVPHSSSPGLTWDDTLYPQEIASVSRLYMPSYDSLLPATTPKPLWTIQTTADQVIGGDSTVVILRAGSYLLGINMNTGAQLWPAIYLNDTTSCAVRQNRIACVAPDQGGSDSTILFLDADSGQILKTLKVPNRELSSVVVSGDRFIALTDIGARDKKGFAVGYTTEGDQVWTYEGHVEDLYVVSSEGILVDSDDSDEVTFISTADGHEVLRSTRNSTERSFARDLVWSVFDGGIAIQNPDGTGTDIYDLNGTKKSSVAGWEPASYQNYFEPAASPLPLLDRLGDNNDEPGNYPDKHIVAAASPDTGHLLWRISGPELSTEIVTVGDKIIMKVADPKGPRDVTGELEAWSGPLVRVYDCFTGVPVSPPISMAAGISGQLYRIISDGFELIYTGLDNSGKQLSYVTSAYDIQSGVKRWDLPSQQQPGYVGDSMVAESGPGAVSRFW